MTATQHARDWTGPVMFSYGFRPFFFCGALWAAIAMALWMMMLTGLAHLPTRFDAVSWHAHEFLFGYLSAIIAGFLLTAVPNWTGRPPSVGWPLAGLFAVWVAGRLSLAVSDMIPELMPVAVDLFFPVLLSAMILREIIAGKNWRNLVILALLALFTCANLLFHIEALRGDVAAHGVGLRLGVATVLMMISVIGGRIIPSFTRNFLVEEGCTDLPTPPMQRFDKITLVATSVALICWVTAPIAAFSGVALVAIGALHFVRLIRWKPYRILREPLLWVLHLGYFFVPLGAVVEGLAIVLPDLISAGAAQHIWMAGGFALMTLAVMTRATLGHTGQELRARTPSVLMFLCVLVSVFCRLGGSLFPDDANASYAVSALFWIAGFAGFVAIYGRSLISPKLGPLK